MQKIDYELKLSQDGIVKGFIWKEEAIEKKGVVLIAHGMAEHIERYDAFARFLATNGYVVFGYDQRGHGRSLQSMADMGYMSDVDNFEIMVADVHANVLHIQSLYPSLPIALLGHSMGSFITQRYIELYGNTLKTAILSGSNFNHGLLIQVGHFLSCIITSFKGRRYRSKLMDQLSLQPYNKAFAPNRTAVDWLSRDEAIVDAYVADPYCGKLFTVSYFKDLLKGFKNIQRNIEIIPNDLPIFLFSGTKDPVGNFGKGITELYEKLKATGIQDIELKLYEDGRHESLNEINKQDVYQDVLEWLNKKMK